VVTDFLCERFQIDLAVSIVVSKENYILTSSVSYSKFPTLVNWKKTTGLNISDSRVTETLYNFPGIIIGRIVGNYQFKVAKCLVKNTLNCGGKTEGPIPGWNYD
jgi:hypothetical protein